MSQSVIKNLPALLNQRTLEKSLNALRQPAGIAAIASLGIHSLLGFGLPYMSPAAKQPDQRSVQVVELSPAERSRLPETASSSTALFPPNISPSSPSNLTPLPGQKPAPAPSPADQPFNDFSSIFNTPPFFSPPPLTITVPPTFTNPPQTTRPGQREATNPPPSPKPSPTPSPTPTTSPSPSGSPDTTGGDPSPTPTTSPSPSGPVRSEKIPPAALERLRQLQAQQRAAGQPPAEGGNQSQSEGLAQLNQWLAQIASAENVPVETLTDGAQKPKDVVLACPAETCGKTPPMVSFAMAVSPDGKVLGTPGAFGLTKNKAIDDAALEELKKFQSELSATGKYRLYFLRIQFENTTAQG